MTWETWVQSKVESSQRLKKWYLMIPCLTLRIIRYGSRVKWSNPEKGIAPSPTPQYSSFWKQSLMLCMYPFSQNTKILDLCNKTENCFPVLLFVASHSENLTLLRKYIRFEKYWFSIVFDGRVQFTIELQGQIWRYSWYKGCYSDPSLLPQFKSWSRLCITLIWVGNVWILLFSLQLWVNCKTDWVL